MSLHFDVYYLIGLCWNCYYNGEYLIGIRLLRFALMRTNNKKLIHYVRRNWSELMLKLREKWKKSMCNNCKMKNINTRLKACRGCQRVYYCSRSCQKNSWNNTHRFECSAQWQNHQYICKAIARPLCMSLDHESQEKCFEHFWQNWRKFLPCDTDPCKARFRRFFVRFLKLRERL